MTSGFVHSIKVPRLYKSAAKIVQEVREKGGSLKSLIYRQKHPNVSAIYSLCLNTLQREEQLDHLIKKTNILVNEPRLQPWLAKILITELLWGKKALKTECKPAQTILAYEQKFREELSNISDIDAVQKPHKTVKKARYVRINTLLVSLEKGISYFQEEGWSFMPKCPSYVEHLNVIKNLKKPNFIQDFHISELLIFPPDTTFHDHPGYQNGEILLQDKASCLPSHLLNPEPGSTVLDLCAAPGMKSSHLAAIMGNKGKIYAVEIDERRYKTLCEQVRITNATSVETVNKDALILNPNEYPNVEYILVDPTCSGSGMLDRQIVHGNEKCDPQRLKQLQAFQVFILRHALLNFPNVKRIVYSTCSIYPEENEQVIDEILENVQDAYKLSPVKDLLNQNWLNFSSKKYNCSDKCLYANSVIDLCNGFFVAVFERNFDVPLPEYKRKGNVALNNREVEEVKEVEALHLEKANTTRKRKKRGKRKSANQGPSKDEEKSDSISILNVSSDSAKIVQEINIDNDNDSSQNDGDESCQNDDDEHSENDNEVAIKKKKRKIERKIMQLPRKGLRLSLHKEVTLQKKKRKTL
ncbi:nop2/Sun-like domain containing protein 5 [Bombus vancouverensis nearcticus]|uniref:Probable 28S rRNA (Cytosine-C(5))-methyltransferase n=1 Tax=Bombus bifarius TaxID=103933 RepID=A0A6P8MQB6_9HYME|nr:probable 28S rRNA (cytosine-C(5))-methyltransferase [Bombus vancouverensis nearcticus]XP_033311059.1 probable 28S rRNA (cytosine-C(5))-methyltransferase [Bombus bifarius]